MTEKEQSGKGSGILDLIVAGAGFALLTQFGFLIAISFAGSDDESLQTASLAIEGVGLLLLAIGINGNLRSKGYEIGFRIGYIALAILGFLFVSTITTLSPLFVLAMLLGLVFMPIRVVNDTSIESPPGKDDDGEA